MKTLEINYGDAYFITSSPSLKQCPPDEGIEIAFVGRSNSGKSSAINTLTGIRGLARTSKTPGRTQQIIFFQLGQYEKLVDLPGYGYAKVSKTTKRKWDRELMGYLQFRKCLHGLILLADIRHVIQEYDRRMLLWAKSVNLPVHVLLTKSDKLGKMNASSTLLNVNKQLREIDPKSELFTSQLFSSLKKTGIDQLKTKINQWFGQFDTDRDKHSQMENSQLFENNSS